MRAEALDELRRYSQIQVDEGFLSSCQYALALDGRVVATETLGAAPQEARYLMWSSTKPVVASLIWQLVSEEMLSFDLRVCDVWPEFGSGGKELITVDHLLQHTAGVSAAHLSTPALVDRHERVQQMERWQTESGPGSAFAYHAFSAHAVLAELIDRVTGDDYRSVLRDRILDPLGLPRLALGVPEHEQHDVMPLVESGALPVASELAQALGMHELTADIESVLARMAEDNGTEQDHHVIPRPAIVAAGVPGAGGVSDASSVAIFYQHLLHDPQGLWDRAVLADATSNARNRLVGGPFGAIAMRTRGLELQGDDPTARFRSGSGEASPQTFGHGGAGGQIAWADPSTGLSFAFLTNGWDLNFVHGLERVRKLSALAAACMR